MPIPEVFLNLFRETCPDHFTTQAEEWFPMETAPEHIPILVWVPGINRGRDSAEVVIIIRDHDDPSGRGYSIWTNGGPNGGSDLHFDNNPTHWRPLPSAPCVPSSSPAVTALKPGTRVVIVGAKHRWKSVAGTLAAYERFGIASRGWRVKLDNGFECYAAPDDLVATAPPPQRGAEARRRDDYGETALQKRIGDLMIDGEIPEWAAEQLDELAQQLAGAPSQTGGGEAGERAREHASASARTSDQKIVCSHIKSR